ncbi:MAG: hypothetical protein ACXADO_04090 [Candidatus Thorarchaeota archaeon]|jgi:hypothetical protein
MQEYLDDIGLERLRRVAGYNRVALIEDTEVTAEEAAMFLRSGLNGRVYATAESWMLPIWAIKKSQKHSVDETGFANDTHRNWTFVGGVGTRRYAVIDSSGLLTVLPECGSLDFWIQNGAEIVFPALSDSDGPRLVMTSPEDQVLEWKHIQSPVEFTRLIYHACNGEYEYIYNEILVKNHSLKDAAITFYVAVRPLSMRGVEPIERLEFDAAKRHLYANGVLAVVLDKQPNAVVMTTADNTNLPASLPGQTNRLDREFSAAKGLATAILRYDVKLAPAASKRFFFTSALTPIEKSAEGLVFQPNPRARDKTVGSWFDFSDGTTMFTLPDRGLDPAVVQAKASLTAQAASFVLPEDDSITMTNWPEKARVLLALSAVGCLDQARALLSTTASLVADNVEEYDSLQLSPILWSLLQYHLHSQDDSYLHEIGPLVGHLVRAIGKGIELQTVEPQPPPPEDSVVEYAPYEGAPSYLGVNDIIAATRDVLEEPPPMEDEPPRPEPWGLQEVINALWNLSAFSLGIDVCHGFGDDRNIDALRETLQDYETLVKQTVDSLLKEAELFSSPRKQMQAFELVTTVSLLRTKVVNANLLSNALDSIKANLVSNNLVKVLEPATRISGHLGLRLAQYMAQLKAEYEVEQLLKRALEFQDVFYNLPDFVDVKTGGGSYGSGSSIKAAADLLLLVREMIVSMSGDILVVLPAVPDWWYTSTVPLAVENLPTIFGSLDIEVGASPNQHQIEVRMKNLPQEILIHLPTLFSLPMMKAFGGGIVERIKDSESPFIRVVPLSNTLVVTIHQ